MLSVFSKVLIMLVLSALICFSVIIGINLDNPASRAVFTLFKDGSVVIDGEWFDSLNSEQTNSIAILTHQ